MCPDAIFHYQLILFKRLTQIRITDTLNKKLRQKELLPMDRLTYEALYQHEPLDRDGAEEHSGGEGGSAGSDYSDYSYSNSGEYSSESNEYSSSDSNEQ